MNEECDQIATIFQQLDESMFFNPEIESWRKRIQRLERSIKIKEDNYALEILKELAMKKKLKEIDMSYKEQSEKAEDFRKSIEKMINFAQGQENPAKRFKSPKNVQGTLQPLVTYESYPLAIQCSELAEECEKAKQKLKALQLDVKSLKTELKKQKCQLHGPAVEEL